MEGWTDVLALLVAAGMGLCEAEVTRRVNGCWDMCIDIGFLLIVRLEIVVFGLSCFFDEEPIWNPKGARCCEFVSSAWV